jgi:hypothetical protein
LSRGTATDVARFIAVGDVVRLEDEPLKLG